MSEAGPAVVPAELWQGGDEQPIALNTSIQRDTPPPSRSNIQGKRGHQRTASGGSVGKSSKGRRGSSKAYASLNSRPPTPEDAESDGDSDAEAAIAEATIPAPTAAEAPLTPAQQPWAFDRSQVREHFPFSSFYTTPVARTTACDPCCHPNILVANAPTAYELWHVALISRQSHFSSFFGCSGKTFGLSTHATTYKRFLSVYCWWLTDDTQSNVWGLPVALHSTAVGTDGSG